MHDMRVCDFTVVVVLSFSSLPLFKCFQVLMMMPMLIDMIAWATAQMLMDGMSESVESRLVFF